MKTSLSILAAAAALAFAAPLRAATVPVTVTIDSVRNINVGDAWSRPPDFYARIWIDGAVLRTPTMFDSNGFVSPRGWTFTKPISRAKRGGIAPVRIELFDWDDPFSDPQVDIDPGFCQSGFPYGCAEVAYGGPDSYGVDVNLNLFDGSWTAAAPGGDSNLGPPADANPRRACTMGVGSNTANVCFTITVGAAASETLTVSKTGDSNRAFCAPGDCSLREAIAHAESLDTVELPASATPYLLADHGNVHLAIRPPPSAGATLEGQIYHLLYLRGPKNGGTAVIRQTWVPYRVFDVHEGAKLVMSHVTVTGGGAYKGSTAHSGHIHGGGVHNHGTIELNHVTITGNRATFSTSDEVGGGGGIYNARGAHAKLTNVTIAGNLSASNEGGIPLGGGIAGPGLFTLRNTVIASNTFEHPEGRGAGFSNCGPGGRIGIAMNIVDEGGNLQFPGSECGRSVTFAWPGRSPWTYWRPLPTALTDPLSPLDPLRFIYPPTPGGPAVDTGVAGCGPTDQAGRPAPRASGVVVCDAGAIEAQ